MLFYLLVHSFHHSGVASCASVLLDGDWKASSHGFDFAAAVDINLDGYGPLDSSSSPTTINDGTKRIDKGKSKWVSN